MKSPFSSYKSKYQSRMDRRTLQVGHKGSLIIFASAVVQLGLLLGLFYMMHDAEQKQFQQMHANAIIFEAGNLQRLVHDAGIAIGGYSITKNAMYGERSEKIVASIRPQLTKLHNLVVGDRKLEMSMVRLENETNTGIDMLNNAREGIRDSSQTQGFRRVRDLYNELRDVTNSMGVEIETITASSIATQEMSTASYEHAKFMVRFFMYLSLGGTVVLAFALLAYFNSSITKRLKVVADNATRAMRGEALARPLTGTDEIAQIDQRLHTLSTQLLLAPLSHAAQNPDDKEDRTEDISEGIDTGGIIKQPVKE